LIYIGIAYRPIRPAPVGFIQHVPAMHEKAFFLLEFLKAVTLPLGGYLSVTLIMPVALTLYLQLKIRIYKNG